MSAQESSTATPDDRGNHADGSPATTKPALDPDPVVEFYKRDVDRTLLRENLRLTPTERVLKAQEHQEFVESLRAAGQAAKRSGALR